MSPLRFFTAEDPDMARVRAIRRQVFVQDLGRSSRSLTRRICRGQIPFMRC